MFNELIIITVLLLSGCTEKKIDDLPILPDIKYESDFSIGFDLENTKLVSDMLMGFNLIYPHEKNSIWQDNKVAGYLRDVNVSFLRYPGGTVASYYHWDALTGEGWKDSWDPENPVTPKSSSEFMDIDEYIELVKATGATPLVGINMSSGWRWDRMQDGIDEAIALMEYCKSKNFDVEYWYLDNEPYQEDSNGGAKSPEQYGDLINLYVPAMKEIKPDIKIIANWNAGYRNKRSEHERLLKRAGNNIDVMDIHWYWSWSDTSWEKWLDKTPMVEWTGFNYMEDIRYYKKLLLELGLPDIKMASLEWNTGPISIGNSLTAARAAMVQTEMMMQFIAGGLDYAVFWPVHWPDQSSKPRSLVDTSNNKPNPNYYLFQFFGKLLGGEFIPANISIDNIFAFAVRDDHQNLIRICVLNKNAENLIAEINVQPFQGVQLKEAQRYFPNPDGSMYVLEAVSLLDSKNNDSVQFLSKGLSFTMLSFTLN